MNLGTAQVIQGDARHLPLADDSVDLVVTSPPYFALRSYQDGGEHYDGQIGSEGTPAEFVAALLEVTRECVRVLKPSGSLFVNLGDKYSQRVATRPSSHQDGLFPDREDLPKDWKRDKAAGLTRMPYQNVVNPSTGQYVREKSLIGIPWRYALACIDDLGLILRAELIWSKPNGLPESVTDRVRRSHEQWFHFTLEPRYFSAVDEIREAHGENTHAKRRDGQPSPRNAAQLGPITGGVSQLEAWSPNPLGKLPGSVWSIPTQPLQVPDHLGIDHFAAFPTEWPKRIIQGWSPRAVCSDCGFLQGRARQATEASTQALRLSSLRRHDSDVRDALACPHCGGTSLNRPVVADIFGGTGTTALVAKALGRHGITLDMSADYCRLAEWRTNDRDSLAKVLGVAKAAPVAPEQLDLFGEATA